MGKQEFLAQLRKGLQGLPQEDIEERLTFYSEMIDDRMEEGLSEEAAVSATGSVNEIVGQIVGDTTFARIAKERIKPKGRLQRWEILLLVLGFPLWFPLCIAAIAVVFSLYISIWAVVISLWAGVVSVGACTVGGVVAAIALFLQGHSPAGLAMLGAGFVCAGLFIFLYYGCKTFTVWILKLTKNLGIWIKNRFAKKEGDV